MARQWWATTLGVAEDGFGFYASGQATLGAGGYWGAGPVFGVFDSLSAFMGASDGWKAEAPFGEAGYWRNDSGRGVYGSVSRQEGGFAAAVLDIPEMFGIAAGLTGSMKDIAGEREKMGCKR